MPIHPRERVAGLPPHARLRAWICLPWLLCGTTALAADAVRCDVERAAAELAASPSATWISSILSQFDSARCSSVFAVLKMANAAPRVAGRKLEPDKAPDAAAAAAQRAAAASDPRFAEALRAELEGETDARRRLLREAAVLYEAGKFKAAAAIVQQLAREATP